MGQTALAQNTPLTLADPNANETTRQVYAYVVNLNQGESNRVLSGQFASHGNEVVSEYDKYIEEIARQTGVYPAVISIDYEYNGPFTLPQLLSANEKLIEHWDAGGLVSINWTAREHWTNAHPAHSRTVSSQRSKFTRVHSLNSTQEDMVGIPFASIMLPSHLLLPSMFLL